MGTDTEENELEKLEYLSLISKEIELEAKSKRRDGEEEECGSRRERDRDYRRERCRDRDRGRDRDRDDYDDGRAERMTSERHRDRDRDNEDDAYAKGRRDEYEQESDDDRRDMRKSRHHVDEPELYAVYKGRVSRVIDSGCFVQLSDFRGKEGLVHVSQLATRRVTNAKDLVKRDQEVFVKGISISGQKLSLSMRDVDQNTGKDLLPLKKSLGDDRLTTNPSTMNGEGSKTRIGLSGIRIMEQEVVIPSRRPLKRMSSPEKWKAKQLIAAGVLGVQEHPMFDEEGDGMLYQEEGAEEELEVELNEDEPPFLQGQSRYSVDMSPVKNFKNPEGSLSHAAALQSALIKERREVREQQQRTMLDSIPKDLNRPWEDQCQRQVRGI
ncbi:hypothetical protein KY289_030729 [Solanum tuberosum]|nr:hypothetical protein KY289_030729 [Solanum tuberosum]